MSRKAAVLLSNKANQTPSVNFALALKLDVNATDYSGNGHTASNYGSPTYSGGALSLNGSSAVQFAGSPDFEYGNSDMSFGVEFSVGNFNNAVLMTNAKVQGMNNGRFTLRLDFQGKLQWWNGMKYVGLFSNPTNEYLVGANDMRNTSGNKVICTFNRATKESKMYLNGSVIASFTDTDILPINRPTYNGEKLTIGAFTDNSEVPDTNFFNGSIKNVFIIKQALSGSDITDVWTWLNNL